MSENPSWLEEESLTKSTISNPLTKKITQTIVNEKLKEYSLSTTNENENEDIESNLTHNNSIQLDINEDELKLLKKYSLYLRGSFIICASLMILIAILNLSSSSLGDLFIALYVFFFGVIICCYEIALSGISRWIAQNFGFMYTKVGRILFILFVAFLCFDLGLFGILVMCLLIVAICGNLYVLYKCPKYEEWIRQQHFKNMTNK